MTNLTGSNLNNGLAVGPKGEGRDSPSTYPAYPEYKDSGVEWLGEIPEHWKVKKLRYLFEKIQTGTTPDTNKTEYFDGNIYWFNPKDLDNELLKVSNKTLSNVAVEHGIVKLFPKNSVLIVAIGATTGKTSYLQVDSTFNQQITGFHSTSENNKYLFYLLKSLSIIFLNIANYTTLPILNNEFFKSFILVRPAREEQTQIATFLDRETQKIDRLIEKQQQLIKLLQEKRQAVISHAVTKGLNPNAKMKDSGVEWLGEIPEHWEVKRLKFACSLVTKKVPTENLKVIALENIESQTGKYIQTDSIYTGEDVGFVGGDILFGKLRPYLAKVYMADGCGVAFGDLLVYRPVDNVLSDYAFYQMISDGFISTVDSSTYGSKMPRASVEFINDMPFLVPPLEEQNAVSEYVKSRIYQFEKLIDMTDMAIRLSKERRTALISAAVTGKIDVRNVAVNDTNSQITEQEVAAL